MDKDEYVLGIDLGTTYTCVGVMRNDKIEIIPNQLGNRLTPSWVSFTEKETLIGYAAKNKSISNLKNTIYCVKRIIGRNFSDPIVQNDIKLFPFKVIKNSKTDKPLIQIANKNGKKDYYPEQISSMILKHVKKYSEEFLGKKVNKAVISVPAYFNESQKKATKVAGEIAGLNVIRIINEPTAGAIAYGYGINNKINEKKNILVFDLGGGTYDISILKLEKNKFTVLSINGDTHLGGEDFDNKLLDFCVEEFKKETEVDIKNHKNSEKALRRLKNACEKAKEELSESKSIDFEIESLIDGIDFNIKLNRADLEYSCHTLFEKLIPPIKEALKDAKLNKENIDDIILVGGSSRIPKIQEMLMKFFNKKNLNKTVNLDEIVAEGAAMQAYILKGNLNLNIININPISLGVKSDTNEIENVMSIIIPKNTQLPCKLSQIYKNKSKNQKNALFEVYQGENKMAVDNYYLDSFRIYGLRSALPGEIEFDVKMELDENGILKVSAKEIEGSHYDEIEIEGVNDLTKEQIEFFRKQE